MHLDLTVLTRREETFSRSLISLSVSRALCIAVLSSMSPTPASLYLSSRLLVL